MVETRIAGFYRWPLAQRRAHLAAMLGREISELGALDPETLSIELADALIENVVGVLGLPVGLGLNLTVNGEDVLVPMAIEEPSVIAAFSHAAKIARACGGFVAEADASVMIGQIQLCAPGEADAERARARLESERAAILAVASEAAAAMRARGGGVRGVEIRKLSDPEGGAPMIVVHLLIDVVDAMGANIVNQIAEHTAPKIAEIAALPVNLRILSNLCAHRLARARVAMSFEAIGGEGIGGEGIGGEEVARRVAEADRFARLDPYRAATHNKGLLNGIDAVAVATGNDWRAIEAGAHAWAARDGQYRGLTRWIVEDGTLKGSLELPLAVGTVGGTTRSHPTIALLRSMIGVESARELAAVLAAVGLAQNFAALRALATEGIQRGHMELHNRRTELLNERCHLES